MVVRCGVGGMRNAGADSLTKHLNALSLDDFRTGGNAVAKHFSSQGIPTKFIPEELGAPGDTAAAGLSGALPHSPPRQTSK